MISVIIPLYNAQNYIERAISGLIGNSEIQIIIVDDASSDNSLEILKKYSDKITLIKNEKNMGTAFSRNKGILAAKGEYIGFLDNDDWADYSYYEKMREEIEKNNADICVALKITNHTDKISRTHLLFNKNLRKTIFIERTAPWTKLYKKDFLINNSIFFDDGRGEDIFPAFLSAFLAKKIAYQSEIPYNCTIRKNSISHRAITLDDLAEIKVYKKILNYLFEFKNENLYKTWFKYTKERAFISMEFLLASCDNDLKPVIIQEFTSIFEEKHFLTSYKLFLLKRRFQKLVSFLYAKFARIIKSKI